MKGDHLDTIVNQAGDAPDRDALKDLANKIMAFDSDAHTRSAHGQDMAAAVWQHAFDLGDTEPELKQRLITLHALCTDIMCTRGEGTAGAIRKDWPGFSL